MDKKGTTPPKRPAKVMVGWRETVSLPALGMNGFQAKIDTGARTTALHARAIELYRADGRPMVRFTLDHSGIDQAARIELPVLHLRSITNTSGIPEQRVIITTVLQLGPRGKRVEISLSDRTDMVYPMIIGRTALRILRLTVDPARSWLATSKHASRKDTV